MTSQNTHDTFNSLSANQEFSMDDIVKDLEMRQRYLMENLTRNFNHLSTAVDKNVLAYPSSTYETAAEAVNAYIIAKSMRDNGMETITLNPGKNLYHQIIAQATSENCPIIKESPSSMPHTYAQKLKS